MNTYATYLFYVNRYGGSAAETEFTREAFKASRYLDKITFNRAATITDPDTLELLSYAVCDMADQLIAERSAKVDGKDVKSVSNDGYSVSFVTEADGTNSSISQGLYGIAANYLPGELLSFVLEGDCYD